MEKKKTLIIWAVINIILLGFIIPLLAEAEDLVSGAGIESAIST